MNATESNGRYSRPECRRAVAIGQDYERNKWELSGLLKDIRDKKWWRDTSAFSFEAFVVEHVGLGLRTAQELIRMITKCHELGIPRERMEELGWSKFATVVSRMNKDNKDEVLRDVKALSLEKLREKYRGRATSEGKKPVPRLELTEPIQKALCQAGRHTMSNDVQRNLEFVCVKFVELVPLASPRLSEFSRN